MENYLNLHHFSSPSLFQSSCCTTTRNSHTSIIKKLFPYKTLSNTIATSRFMRHPALQRSFIPFIRIGAVLQNQTVMSLTLNHLFLARGFRALLQSASNWGILHFRALLFRIVSTTCNTVLLVGDGVPHPTHGYSLYIAQFPAGIDQHGKLRVYTGYTF